MPQEPQKFCVSYLEQSACCGLIIEGGKGSMKREEERRKTVTKKYTQNQLEKP